MIVTQQTTANFTVTHQRHKNPVIFMHKTVTPCNNRRTDPQGLRSPDYRKRIWLSAYRLVNFRVVQSLTCKLICFSFTVIRCQIRQVAQTKVISKNHTGSPSAEQS